MTSTTGAPPRQDAALLRLGSTLKAAGYRFTTVTPATHERVNRRPGNELGRSLTDVLGWSRPFRTGALPDDVVTLLDEAGALRRDGDLWRSLIRVSGYDGELFVHSAFPAAPDAVFSGPDTQRTVDAALAHLAGRATPPGRVADVGTGSGAVAVAKRVPQARWSPSTSTRLRCAMPGSTPRWPASRMSRSAAATCSAMCPAASTSSSPTRRS